MRFQNDICKTVTSSLLLSTNSEAGPTNKYMENRKNTKLTKAVIRTSYEYKQDKPTNCGTKAADALEKILAGKQNANTQCGRQTDKQTERSEQVAYAIL